MAAGGDTKREKTPRERKLPLVPVAYCSFPSSVVKDQLHLIKSRGVPVRTSGGEGSDRVTIFRDEESREFVDELVTHERPEARVPQPEGTMATTETAASLAGHLPVSLRDISYAMEPDEDFIEVGAHGDNCDWTLIIYLSWPEARTDDGGEVMELFHVQTPPVSARYTHKGPYYEYTRLAALPNPWGITNTYLPEDRCLGVLFPGNVEHSVSSKRRFETLKEESTRRVILVHFGDQNEDDDTVFHS